MTDSVDTSLTRTYTLTLIVINDVCTPDIDISGISITDPIEYVIGDSAITITGLENFSNGDCEDTVGVTSRISGGSKVWDADFLTKIESGRTFTNVQYHSNQFILTNPGSISLEI